MAHLSKTTTHLLSEDEPFKHERDLEAFIITNPNILAYSKEKPAQGLLPVYVIGRQDSVSILEKDRKGRTDITCLIWVPLAKKYRIWIYELKKEIASSKGVDQLLDYINSFNDKDKKKKLIDKAIDYLSDEETNGQSLIDIYHPIRGALCAQDFEDEVYEKMAEVNSTRIKNGQDKLEAVAISKFHVDDDIFVVVDRVLGTEKKGKTPDLSIRIWEAIKIGKIKEGTILKYDDKYLSLEMKRIKENNPDVFALNVIRKSEKRIVKWQQDGKSYPIKPNKNPMEEWIRKNHPNVDIGFILHDCWFKCFTSADGKSLEDMLGEKK